MSAAFDWPVLMRAGIRGLGLRPAEFWALTPAELTMMLGRGSGAAPLDRDRLAALAAAYPDDPGPDDLGPDDLEPDDLGHGDLDDGDLEDGDGTR